MSSYFVPNDTAQQIANTLIPEFHSHLTSIEIAYILKVKTQLPEKKENKKPQRKGKKITMAKTSRVSEKMRTITTKPYQFIIEFDYDIWDELSDAHKVALVDHELAHCGNDADGCYLKHHGLEEFPEIVTRHGLWKSDIKHFAEAADEPLHNQQEMTIALENAAHETEKAKAANAEEGNQ